MLYYILVVLECNSTSDSTNVRNITWQNLRKKLIAICWNKEPYGVASAPHLQRWRPPHMLTQSNQLDQHSENLQKRLKYISSTTHRAPAKEVMVTKCSQLCSHIREAGLIQSLILTGHLYLTGALLSVGLKADTKKTCIPESLDYVLKICQHFRLNGQHNGGCGRYMCPSSGCHHL